MRLSYLTVNLIRGSLCECDLNAKYNNASSCGECVLFSFFSSSVSTGFGLSVCYFIFQLSLMFFNWILFLELY